jgi:hypothetical protein
VVEQVKTLSLDEQRQLRALLDSLLAASPPETAEDALDRKLQEQGLLRMPNKAGRPVRDEFRPVKIEGKPLSETILEERR